MSSLIDWPDSSGAEPERLNPARATARAANCVFNGAVAAVIVALFAPLGVLAHPTVRRILLAVAVLNIPLPLGTYIGDREYAAEYGSLYGFSISLTTIALVGLYLPLLVRERTGVRAEAPRRSAAGRPLILYILFCTLSVLVADDATLALYEVTLFLQLGLLYFYIVRTVTSREEVVFVVKFLLLGLAIEALLMVALAGGLAKLGFLGPWVNVSDDSLVSGLVRREISFLGLRARVDEVVTMGVARVGGTIGSPNDAATYLSMALTVAVSALAVPLGHWYRRLIIFGLGSGIIALIWTFSRGAWIALILGIGILAWSGLLGSLVRRIPRRVSLWVAADLVLAGVFLYSIIGFRLTMDDRGSAESRGPLNRIAVLMIEDHPLLGVGANNFPVAMQPYITRGFAGEFLYTVHNRYLLIGSETGLIGLAAYLWFLLATLCVGWHCWSYRDSVLSPLALGCTAALAGHMFHMFWEPFRGQSVLQLVFVIAALLVVMERVARDSHNPPGRVPAYAAPFPGFRS